MTTIVGKYTLWPDCAVTMPEGAELLSVHEQWGELQLWALLDPTRPSEIRQFRIFGTGYPIDNVDNLHFVGTALLEQGSLVFHVFEER